MPSGAAFFPDAYLSRLQIYVIVNDDQLCLRVYFIVIDKLPYRITAQVHIGKGLCQYHFFTSDHPFAVHCLVLDA